jgi:hypothetical protein
MKPGSIEDPDTYLGSRLKRVLLDNGVICWGLSASKYIRESISNVEGYLSEKSLPKLKTKARGPWPHEYVSKLCSFVDKSILTTVGRIQYI